MDKLEANGSRGHAKWKIQDRRIGPGFSLQPVRRLHLLFFGGSLYRHDEEIEWICSCAKIYLALHTLADRPRGEAAGYANSAETKIPSTDSHGAVGRENFLSRSPWIDERAVARNPPSLPARAVSRRDIRFERRGAKLEWPRKWFSGFRSGYPAGTRWFYQPRWLRRHWP